MARGRLLDAQRAAVSEEADELQAVIDEKQAAIDAHEAKTAQLLKALEDHAHEDYRPYRPTLDEIMQAGGRVTVKRPKAAALWEELASLRRQHQVLSALVCGDDPRQVVPEATRADYPPSVWGPDAVLPAPSYLRSLAEATA